VHTILLDHEGVETASEGRDPARFIVVRPRRD
jgi:predicted RNA-binding protein Jag